MTREEAMQKAIKEANAFCNKFDRAPYGKTFSEFKTITMQEFFTKIYNNDHEAQLKAERKKSRSIVAMLFWKYVKFRRLHKTDKDFSQEAVTESYFCFKQAYKMLKDNA